MLASLRHHAVVGGDDEKCEVHAGRPGHHILDEPLVSRHIDDAETKPVVLPIGKAEVDGNAACFFFRQPVGRNSRQSSHQPRLAVVNMPGGADDDVFE